MTDKTFYDILDTPIGPLTLIWSEKGLRGAYFKGHVPGDLMTSEKALPDNPYRAAFEAYFDGEKNAFNDLPLDLQGTPFQKAVWALLLKIPEGQTRCYGDLAKALGDPGASRAVGWANGKNPISIAVPCHRVIGKDGSLTGYAGGLKRKAWLLEHEGVKKQLSFPA